MASTRDVQQHRVPLRHPGQAHPRAVVPQQRRARSSSIDQRDGKSENFAYSGGVKGFVEYMNRARSVLHPQRSSTRSARRTASPSRSRCSGTTRYAENVQCFTNNIPQRDGGTHLTGLRQAMTRTLNNYIEKEEIAKKAKVETTGDDMREGLTCVLSVKVPEPKFSLADQGQAGVLRSAADRAGDRRARSSPTSCSRSPHDAKIICTQDRRGRARARGGAQGARAHAPQGRARRHGPARQARRLPGARSGAVRALPRRGRFRRRLGQAGPRPQVPGDPAAARQDPQRRARAHRQGDLARRRSSR